MRQDDSEELRARIRTIEAELAVERQRREAAEAERRARMAAAEELRLKLPPGGRQAPQGSKRAWISRHWIALLVVGAMVCAISMLHICYRGLFDQQDSIRQKGAARAKELLQRQKSLAALRSELVAMKLEVSRLRQINEEQYLKMRSGWTEVPGTWIKLAAGRFVMGSPATDSCRGDDEPERVPVTLSHDFEIQSTEVTQEQFLSVMGYNPSKHSACGKDCPVELVSWHEAAAYCNALSAKRGMQACYLCADGCSKNVTCQEEAETRGKGIYACKGYRLPTEAEWEHAYRAGTFTAFYSGENDTSLCNKFPVIDRNADSIAWYSNSYRSGNTTHPVAQKKANAWGLYDMAGNVSEWCHDWYQDLLVSSPATDPVGALPDENVFIKVYGRVQRGGAYNNLTNDLRAASRHFSRPEHRFDNLGFRCARTRD